MARRLPSALAAALAAAALGAGVLVGCGEAGWEDRCATTAAGVIECAPGDRPPPVTVAGELLAGGRYDVATDRGKVVVLNFWGSWCAPCRAEADDLEQTYRATRDSGVAFVGVNHRDTRDAARAFERGRVTFPSLFDPPSRVALSFDIAPNFTPSTIILDRGGRIAVAMRRPTTVAELRPIVERLAGEPAAAGGLTMGEAFAEVAQGGPVLLAVGVALLAGLVSILSPCVLPLLPGYLSYVTGLAGADLDAALGAGAAPSGGEAADAVPPGAGGGLAGTGGGLAVATSARRSTGHGGGRGRVLAGTVLFVLGFTVVFTLMATTVARIGLTLLEHREAVTVAGGFLVIVLGLIFLGLVPGAQRELRVRRLPAAGLAGAPVFGAVFAVSWLPCVGPTLGAVLALATTSGETDRAVLLAVAYSLGLGVPFVAFGLGFRRLLGAFRAVRRHSRWVTRFGGALLVAVGLVMVTGAWNDFLTWLQTTFDFAAGTLL